MNYSEEHEMFTYAREFIRSESVTWGTFAGIRSRFVNADACTQSTPPGWSFTFVVINASSEKLELYG